MQITKDNYPIRDKRQMRALEAGARQEIVDVLPRLGTVSVAELAAALGRAADSLYYHLRILMKAGLVLSAGHRRSNGRKEALFRAIAPAMSLCYDLGKKGNTKEINAIVSSMLRLGARDFSDASMDSETRVSGPDRELWALRNTGWLTREQLVAVNRYIASLMQIVAKPHHEGRLYALTIVLTPLARTAREPDEETRKLK